MISVACHGNAFSSLSFNEADSIKVICLIIEIFCLQSINCFPQQCRFAAPDEAVTLKTACVKKSKSVMVAYL